MKTKILEQFENGLEIPLFYCESGSRLWGMASPDSDFDVRGCHLLSKEQYFGFRKEPDTLSMMDGLFDFESFSLDKLCQLLSKSNPNILEWLRSSIIYYNQMPDWDNFREEVLKNIDMAALYFHYLSLAKSHLILFESGKKNNYKTVFYAIRGLLSAALAARNVLPALDIMELRCQFEQRNEVVALLENAIEQKRNCNENESIPIAQRESILSMLYGYLQSLRSLNISKSGANAKLEKVLKEYNLSVKERFYLK